MAATGSEQMFSTMPTITVWDISSETAVVRGFLPTHGARANTCVRPLALFGDAVLLQGNDGVLQVWDQLREPTESPHLLQEGRTD